jgi:hypothetical protein
MAFILSLLAREINWLETGEIKALRESRGTSLLAREINWLETIGCSCEGLIGSFQ